MADERDQQNEQREALRRAWAEREAAAEAARPAGEVDEGKRQQRIEALQYALENPDDLGAQDAVAELVAEWLDERWLSGHGCPYCGTDHWTISKPAMLRSYIDPEVYPVFPVSCQHCGNTVFISLGEMGFLSEDETEEEGPGS